MNTHSSLHNHVNATLNDLLTLGVSYIVVFTR
jgi:hypothetical protein